MKDKFRTKKEADQIESSNQTSNLICSVWIHYSKRIDSTVPAEPIGAMRPTNSVLQVRLGRLGREK
jgi:hypothetical protein